MKLCTAALLAGAIFSLFLQSCRKDDVPEENNSLSFAIERHELVYTLVGSAQDYDAEADLTMACRSEIMLPESLLGHDVAELRDSILSMAFGATGANTDSIADAYFRRCAADVGYELVPDSINIAEADSLKRTISVIDNYDGYVAVQGAVVSMTPTLVSLSVNNSSYYPRAAHGIYTVFYVNYNLAKGSVVHLSDLFTEEGMKSLPRSIRRKARIMSSILGPTDITALPQNNNFYIGPDGNLVFVYQPYEVASYAQGEIAVPLEPYTVDALLSPAGRHLLLNE